MGKRKAKRMYRLIRFIQEIKANPCQSIDQLLETHNISRTQFYKDRAELAAIGFEFGYDRSHRRFNIIRDAFLPVEKLSLGERFALIMGVKHITATGDYPLGIEGLNGARKLASDIPKKARECIIPVLEDIVMKKGFGCRLDVLKKLSLAVKERRRIIVQYKRPDRDTPSEEEIDPYRVFFKRRALYLDGFSWNQRALCIFRVNRIEDVFCTAMLFSIPRNYDFGRRHRNAFSACPGDTTRKVVVRFSKAIRAYIEESMWHHSQEITELSDGSILYEVHVAEPKEVMWWSFHWCDEAEILEPEWLRKEAAARVWEMERKYAKLG